jgi:hypothetical protein
MFWRQRNFISRPRLNADFPILCFLWIGCIFAGDRAAAQSPSQSAGEPKVSSASTGIFVEAATASGLEFVHFNGMSGKYYFPESVGSGVALFDYDNDGDLDVYLVQGAMLGPDLQPDQATFPPQSPLFDRLYRNDLREGPDGAVKLSFTDVTDESGIIAGGYGLGVTTGDYDNDGWVDIYLTNLGPNLMFHNNGDGTFSEVTSKVGTEETRWSVSAAFVDVDVDGWLDLFVGNYVDFDVKAHKLCRTLTGAPDYCGPLSYRPLRDRLFRNRGDGTFEDYSTKAGILDHFGGALGVIPGDFNSDGLPDIYVANDGVPNQMWMGQKDGGFANRGLISGTAVNLTGRPEASMGVIAADIDADGDEDIFMTHLIRETNTLYLNDGKGFFEDRSLEAGLARASWEFTGFGTVWIDLQNDGWLDLLAANGEVKVIPELEALNDPYPLHQLNLLFQNMGDGVFQNISDQGGEFFKLSEVSRGIAVGDIDNDGDSDAVVMNNSGPVRLLLNQVGNQNHWIGLRLVGDLALRNRDMLGAWVGVFVEGRSTLWRRVNTAGSYASASDPRILVGLGDSTEINRVVVRWPGGTSEEWNPGIDQYSLLRQGDGKEISSDSP